MCLFRETGLSQSTRENFEDIRPHESGEVHPGTDAEGGLELQQPAAHHLRLLDAAGQGERRSPQPVWDAEAGVGLYRPREAGRRVVVAPDLKPYDAQGEMPFEARRIEGAQSERPVRIVFRQGRIASARVNVRTPVERGGAGAVQRERAGDGTRRRLEIPGEVKDGERREGECCGVVGPQSQRQSRVAHARRSAGVVEAGAIVDLVTQGHRRVRRCVVGIELERLFEIPDRDGDALGHRRVRMGQRAEIEVVRAQIVRPLPASALDLGAANARLDDPDDGLRDPVLELEDVFQYAVISVGPEMGTGVRLDELFGDAQAIAALAHAPLEHVANAELAPDLLDVDDLALVGEARIPRDHEQPVDTRQAGDDVLDHAVREIFLVGIAADVLEGQHRDRRLVRQRERRAWRCPRARVIDPVDAYRARDVLQRVLAQVDERLPQLVAHLTPGVLRESDASGLRDALEPRRDVDGVAQQVAAIDDDIAQVYPDPERDAAVGGDLDIAPRHAALHVQRAAAGVDDARKLDENAVAGGLDDAAAMGRDRRLDELHPQ